MTIISNSDTDSTQYTFLVKPYNIILKKEFGPLKKIVAKNPPTKFFEEIPNEIHVRDVGVFYKYQDGVYWLNYKGEDIPHTKFTPEEFAMLMKGIFHIFLDKPDFKPVETHNLRMKQFGEELVDLYEIKEEEGYYWAFYVDHPEFKNRICDVTTYIENVEPFSTRVFEFILNRVQIGAFAALNNLQIKEDNLNEIWKLMKEDSIAQEKKADEEREKRWQEIRAKEKELKDADLPNFDKLVKKVMDKMEDHDFSRINLDYIPRKGGRKAVKSSPKELQELMAKAARKLTKENGWSYEEDDFEDVERLVYIAFDCVYNDLKKVSFGMANPSFDGFRVTPSGINYILASGADDCEGYVSFIIYYDGKRLRGYVPVAGNTYNYVNNKAFSDDEEADAKLICKELGIKYNLTAMHEEFLEAIEMTEAFSELEVDYERLTEDINSRLELI